MGNPGAPNELARMSQFGFIGITVIDRFYRGLSGQLNPSTDIVIPAQAGIQSLPRFLWTPACTGVTERQVDSSA